MRSRRDALPIGLPNARLGTESEDGQSSAELARADADQYDPQLLDDGGDSGAADARANRELRATYAASAYRLAVTGLGFWFLVMSATAIVFGATGKQILSDAVLIAVTTGTTINVLAAFLGVIRGLFPGTSRHDR
ncbi:hypothetical protein [Cupriavidus pampae]|uniref:Uncharacterized protein n=1 Tax=Cupriavidus pampae TaxID=659251 RepID=A0ABM8X6A5_9BURK|nr:hypothetical protein [Cupriavidus pampae]CAG9175397.1 hypothetical protein LMG32289_03306 [Cupriavidus pampae]